MLYVDCVVEFNGEGGICWLRDDEKGKGLLERYKNIGWIESGIGVLEDNSLKMYIDGIGMCCEEYRGDISYIKYGESISYKEYNKDIREVGDYVVNEVVERGVEIGVESIEW